MKKKKILIEYYVNGIEQHLLAGGIQLLESRGRGGREIGQFAAAGILDDATGIRVESVRNAALHLRHVVLAETVRFTQMHLQTLFG